jgi:dephospho-CoA kinase
MISIGLTGGLASGKSLVARIFKSLGCALIDTDAIARAVVVPGTEGWQAVVKEFGPQILAENNTIDRPKLANIIFTDAGRRQILNSILHPLIISSVRQQLAEIGAREPDALVVVDVPLLIECGLQDDFDEVIVVWTSRETQVNRLMERDGLAEAEAQQRLAAQLPLDQKRAYATFVVENDADQEKTEAQVRIIFSELKRGRGRR